MRKKLTSALAMLNGTIVIAIVCGNSVQTLGAWHPMALAALDLPTGCILSRVRQVTLLRESVDPM